MINELRDILDLVARKGCRIDESKLIDDNGTPTPLGYILLSYYSKRQYGKIYQIISYKPGEIILRKTDGYPIFTYPDVVLYHEYLEKIWRPRYTDYKILLPCTGVKPYKKSITHKMMKNYTRRLMRMGIKVSIYSISEPMLIVPEEYEEMYPLSNYDFPPRLMTRDEKELMIAKLAKILPKLALTTHCKVIAVLPKHHMQILQKALGLLSDNYSEKFVLFQYGRLAFRTLREVYEYIKSDFESKTNT